MHLGRVGWAVVLTTISLLGLAANAMQVWGPPWPTQPVFSPGPPSIREPFNVPFNVANKSSLFAINNLKIDCQILFARTSGATTITVRNSVVRSDTLNRLEPDQARSRMCGLAQAFVLRDGRFVEAVIRFKSEYDSPWPFGGRATALSEIFSLQPDADPPHWTPGAPLPQ